MVVRFLAWWRRGEGAVAAEQGPEDVDAAAGKGDDRRTPEGRTTYMVRPSELAEDTVLNEVVGR